jgi:hypothetical protein
MTQTTKIIGLQYNGEIYYTMFINMLKFDSPAEVRILQEHAGITSYKIDKYLLMWPLQGCGDVDFKFTRAPGDLIMRDPHINAFQFVRDRWDDIQSGDVLNTNSFLSIDGDINDYVVKPEDLK